MDIKIQQGQTLTGIARQQGTTVEELLRLNPSIMDPNLIQAGANLAVPEKVMPLVSSQKAGTSTPAIVSSKNARKQFDSDIYSLGKLEGPMTQAFMTPIPEQKKAGL